MDVNISELACSLEILLLDCLFYLRFDFILDKVCVTFEKGFNEADNFVILLAVQIFGFCTSSFTEAEVIIGA